MMTNHVYDIAIIGGGPAGLSAALTGRIRNKDVAIFERAEFSAKLSKAHVVDNYLGMPQITGQGMMQSFAAHALAHDPVLIREKIINIYPGSPITLMAPDRMFQAKTVIIATGVVPTALFEGEKKFLGRGVSYCATCDGMFYKDRDVAVVSYTTEGEHETEYLAELCRNVYYLPQYKAELPSMRSNIQVMPGMKLKSIQGDTAVDKVVTDKQELAVHGVFIMRQSDPVENLLPGLELDGDVIKVNRDMSTSIPGVFAAGDCTGKPWQIAKATGEGLVAVLSAITYLDKISRE